jgi:hypothetical protein
MRHDRSNKKKVETIRLTKASYVMAENNEHKSKVTNKQITTEEIEKTEQNKLRTSNTA